MMGDNPGDKSKKFTENLLKKIKTTPRKEIYLNKESKRKGIEFRPNKSGFENNEISLKRDQQDGLNQVPMQKDNKIEDNQTSNPQFNVNGIENNEMAKQNNEETIDKPFGKAINGTQMREITNKESIKEPGKKTVSTGNQSNKIPESETTENKKKEPFSKIVKPNMDKNNNNNTYKLTKRASEKSETDKNVKTTMNSKVDERIKKAMLENKRKIFLRNSLGTRNTTVDNKCPESKSDTTTPNGTSSKVKPNPKLINNKLENTEQIKIELETEKNEISRNSDTIQINNISNSNPGKNQIKSSEFPLAKTSKGPSSAQDNSLMDNIKNTSNGLDKQKIIKKKAIVERKDTKKLCNSSLLQKPTLEKCKMMTPVKKIASMTSTSKKQITSRDSDKLNVEGETLQFPRGLETRGKITKKVTDKGFEIAEHLNQINESGDLKREISDLIMSKDTRDILLQCLKYLNELNCQTRKDDFGPDKTGVKELVENIIKETELLQKVISSDDNLDVGGNETLIEENVNPNSICESIKYPGKENKSISSLNFQSCEVSESEKVNLLQNEMLYPEKLKNPRSVNSISVRKFNRSLKNIFKDRSKSYEENSDSHNGKFITDICFEESKNNCNFSPRDSSILENANLSDNNKTKVKLNEKMFETTTGINADNPEINTDIDKYPALLKNNYFETETNYKPIIPFYFADNFESEFEMKNVNDQENQLLVCKSKDAASKEFSNSSLTMDENLNNSENLKISNKKMNLSLMNILLQSKNLNLLENKIKKSANNETSSICSNLVSSNDDHIIQNLTCFTTEILNIAQINDSKIDSNDNFTDQSRISLNLIAFKDPTRVLLLDPSQSQNLNPDSNRNENCNSETPFSSYDINKISYENELPKNNEKNKKQINQISFELMETDNFDLTKSMIVNNQNTPKSLETKAMENSNNEVLERELSKNDIIFKYGEETIKNAIKPENQIKESGKTEKHSLQTVTDCLNLEQTESKNVENVSSNHSLENIFTNDNNKIKKKTSVKCIKSNIMRDTSQSDIREKIFTEYEPKDKHNEENLNRSYIWKNNICSFHRRTKSHKPSYMFLRNPSRRKIDKNNFQSIKSNRKIVSSALKRKETKEIDRGNVLRNISKESYKMRDKSLNRNKLRATKQNVPISKKTHAKSLKSRECIKRRKQISSFQLNKKKSRQERLSKKTECTAASGIKDHLQNIFSAIVLDNTEYPSTISSAKYVSKYLKKASKSSKNILMNHWTKICQTGHSHAKKAFQETAQPPKQTFWGLIKGKPIVTNLKNGKL